LGTGFNRLIITAIFSGFYLYISWGISIMRHRNVIAVTNPAKGLIDILHIYCRV
jgi:hypothetical protein